MDKMTKLLEQAKRLAGRDTELGAVLELIDEERDNVPEATLGRVSTALQTHRARICWWRWQPCRRY